MANADPVASAYAVLGLTPGCTPRELKQAYRQLVKRWHPDRFSADPIGQSEATVRLRQINQAFRVVAEAMASPPQASAGPTSNGTPPPAADVRPPAYDPGRPMTREQIDAMVQTLRQESPVELALDRISAALPFVLGFLFLMEWSRWARQSVPERIFGFVCLAVGVVQLARRKTASKGETVR